MKRSVFVVAAIILSIAMPVSAAAISNDGSALSAYWEFSETTGTVAVDSSGNGNTGTLWNDGTENFSFSFDVGSTADRFGNASGALNFRGGYNLGGDFVAVSDSATLDITDGVTIAAWVKMSGIAGDWSTLVGKEHIISPTDPGGSGYDLMVTGNGSTKNTVASWCANDTGTWTGTYSANGVDDDLGIDTWQFIAMVADGTNLQAYVNGVPDGDPVPMSPAPTTTVGDPLAIGASYPWARWFTGDVDEVAIWDGAMDASGIADVYANGVTVTGAAIPGDANRDGVVDSSDAAILADNWLTETGANWRMGDFNSDGAVNDIDATMLATNWTDSGSASVPEPGTIMLLGGMLLILCLRRRK